MPVNFLQKFLKLEAASGIILFSMAALALLFANSPLASLYQYLINFSVFWVNDGLMTLFFLVVGLELKRAFLEGELASLKQVMLPLVAGVGGMVLPALVYLWFNKTPATINGWATPVATDIAFALGVLSLFGQRVPHQLKLFLLVLAIFDDLGAILIIAFYFTSALSWFFLSVALACFAILIWFNRLSISSLIPYLVVGAILWVVLLKAGIHPTIAGVLLAFTIPSDKKTTISPLRRLEDFLHPWVAYFIMPLFALVNAGFSLSGMTFATLANEIVLGIMLGLFLGKQLGVFGFTWILVTLGFAHLPAKSSWTALYGVALLCGIGFTMSLFLGTLAFENESTYLAQVRLGVIMGSMLSGLLGAIVLIIAFARKRSRRVD